MAILPQNKLSASRYLKVLKILVSFDEEQKKPEFHGIDGIITLVQNKIDELTKELAMPESMSKLFEKFREREGLLYNLLGYRDHLVHQFEVFRTGFVLISEIYNIGYWPFVETLDDIIRKWFATAIFHDIAYPLEKIDELVEEFVLDTFGHKGKGGKTTYKGIKKFGLYGMSKILTIENQLFNIIQLVNYLAERFKLEKNHINHLYRLLMDALLVKQDHGVLSALIVFGQNWGKGDKTIALEVATAIGFHSDNVWAAVFNDNDLQGQHLLCFNKWPLAFLLTLCDTIQEWGRRTKTSSQGQIPMLITLTVSECTLKYQKAVSIKDRNKIKGIYDSLQQHGCSGKLGTFTIIIHLGKKRLKYSITEDNKCSAPKIS